MLRLLPVTALLTIVASTCFVLTLVHETGRLAAEVERSVLMQGPPKGALVRPRFDTNQIEINDDMFDREPKD